MHCAGIYVLFMGPATTLFRKKYILKMDFTVLFIYLKIILLQCFSVFSCIQTDPWYIAFRMWEVFEGKMLNKTYIAFQVRML